MSRRVLVTGGAGFIGHHLCTALVEQKITVAVLDDFSHGRKDRLKDLPVEIFEGDIRDPEIVAKALNGVEAVFHLAAFVSVPGSVENPELCESINVEGLKVLIGEAKRQDIKRILFSSSCAVYGNDPELPKREGSILAPISPYADSKLEGEKLLEAAMTDGLSPIILRYFNVYGVGQDPNSQYSGVMSLFIDRASKNEDIEIFGDGSVTRDFVFVQDVVDANIHFFNKQELEGSFLVGSGVETSIKDLAFIVCQSLGSESKLSYKPERRGDTRRSVADITNLLKSGFREPRTVAEGLQDMKIRMAQVTAQGLNF